jgi:predicted MFS family arabinose efflux permease
MAAACGIAAANIYYNQPMLGVIERDFTDPKMTALIPTVTQLGYAAGLFLLVPLGDIVERRRLIVVQFGALALALVMAALAPNAGLLVVASLLVGIAASAAQHIVPFAAALAAPERRGQTVGMVMGGLLCGILLSRVLSGLVADAFGWREMFWLGVPMVLLAAVLMRVMLPAGARPVAGALGYGAALLSLAHLWREEPIVRRATWTQAALFGSFSAFWAILAFHLAEPGLGFGAGVAGLFGGIGAVGVIAAPYAGRLADTYGPRRVIQAGAALVVVSWLLFGLWSGLAGLVVGVVLLDLGIQLAMISHQHAIYACRPEARSRINTLFMTGMFLGGAAGSAGATLAWTGSGWIAVSLFGGALALAALIARLIGR